jgi:hypothetical protein
MAPSSQNFFRRKISQEKVAFVWPSVHTVPRMNFDISDLLNSWEYQAGQIVVRKFPGKDGKEKIQLRVDLGLLQMNAFGRPDGKQPYGHETLLEHYEARLKKYLDSNESDEGFKLDGEDCSKLQQEAIQFHHRYICLFQLKDFAAVLRDTERNIKVFDFVEKYAEAREMAWSVQQLRPQLLMMHIRAKATLSVDAGNHAAALEIVENGIEEIKAFFHGIDRSDLVDSSGEIQSLKMWLEDLRATRPLSEREKLEKMLSDAIQREDYEKAAHYRDKLRQLK